MPHITFSGINTGLPPNLVDQLIEAEKIPVKQMEAKKAKTEERLKLVSGLQGMVNKIDGTLGSLASVTGFSDIKLETGDKNIITGTADTNTPKGSWNVEVESLAQRAAALTNGFPDKNKTQIGTGYFRFQTPTGKKSVYINSKNNTLEGAARAINSAGIGVRASVIQDHSNPKAPYKLMLTGDGVGGAKKIEYPTLYFLDGDQDIRIDKQTPAKNGVIKVDGFEFQTTSNTVNDIIPGVTLNIRQAVPGHQVNITVKEDHAKINLKIKTFVDSMNAVLSFIQQQNHLDEHTDTSRTLGGDILLREVQDRLTSLIQNPQYGVGNIKYLWQVGIQITRDGILKLDQDKFKAALAKSPEDVRKFFVGDGFKTGLGPQLHTMVMNLNDPGFGPIANRLRALQDEISRMDQNIDDKNRQLAQKEKMLREKFARLEETMGRLKQQGSSLAAMAPAYQGPNLSGGQFHSS